METENIFLKTKYINITFRKKDKRSGYHILPMLVLNLDYQNLTFALFRFVIGFQYNSYKFTCVNCGKICANMEEANSHCYYF